jgi:hypothetical protein
MITVSPGQEHSSERLLTRTRALQRHGRAATRREAGGLRGGLAPLLLRTAVMDPAQRRRPSDWSGTRRRRGSRPPARLWTGSHAPRGLPVMRATQPGGLRRIVVPSAATMMRPAPRRQMHRRCTGCERSTKPQVTAAARQHGRPGARQGRMLRRRQRMFTRTAE